MIDRQLKNFKLRAGWAITYLTVIPHQVLSVTKGVRYAGVFWSTSIISDPFMRGIYHGLTTIQQKLKRTDKVYSDLKDFVDDPTYEIEMLKKNLIRRYR